MQANLHLRQSRSLRLFLISTLVFICLCYAGFRLAHYRLIWGDETHTLWGIKTTSYPDLLLGLIPYEGNNTPLFYIFEKIITEGIECPPGSNLHLLGPEYLIKLRIISIICMSLAMTVIFYYFANNFSLLLGFYSLVLFLSSHALWLYWAEGRPYALWVFFSTLQNLLFIHLLKDGYTRHSWNKLIILNISLILTSVFSIFYILGTSLVLWFKVIKDWRKYILTTILPVLLMFYYSSLLPPLYSRFYLKDTYLNLVSTHFTKERLLVLLGAILLILYTRWKRGSVFTTKNMSRSLPFIYLSYIMIFMAVLKLVIFQMSRGDYSVINLRYFIDLTPASVIAMTYLSYFLVDSFSKRKRIQATLICVIGTLVITRVFLTLRLIRSFLGL